MTLFEKLQKVTSEEDVKDIYIKALSLKGYQKNLIDIQTKDIWFEAKDSGKVSTYAMFTQLMHYVQQAINNGEYVPPFLCVIDTHKAAIMKSADVIPFLEKKTIKWGKSASNYTLDALDAVSSFIGTYFVSFKIESHEKEFIETIKNAIACGDIIRTQITPDNLKQVFDKWVIMIGREIQGVSNDDYVLLFYADIMHDGTVATHENLPAQLVHKNNAPAFYLNSKLYELSNKEGYRQFWAIYHKPPKIEYRDYLLERRDTLIPIDERKFKGAYYTPLQVVNKAYEKLNQNLGDNWQKEYFVWDMCCGVGNLEILHSNPRNIFMSTLDQADVDVMKASKICVSAQRFQYDYLNDDISNDGLIDYDLTGKVPESLRKAIKEGKKILILINPPYAESTNFENIAKGMNAENKGGVAKTKISACAMSGYGKASNELFTQFLARIAIEMPNATIAMFSTMKYVNAPNFEEFREVWNAKYIGGFVIENKAFDGLTGKFPIGFLIWKTNILGNRIINEDIQVEVLNSKVQSIGEKTFYILPKNTFLNVWINRPRANNVLTIPLRNAVSPSATVPRVKTWSDNAIAYMYCGVNDLQHAEQQTVIYSSVYGGGNGFYITPDNLWQASIIFSVRRLIKPTWLNDRDQFLQPTKSLSEEFINDCLVWMLFNRCQRTASANDLEWNDQKWTMINHFIPFTEIEVGATDRFDSDFMNQYMADKEFSQESKDVLEFGKKLWQAYFSQTDIRAVRDELKLNRPDVGWFQVRRALEHRNNSGENIIVSFDKFELSYDILTDKLRPQVYDYGFLRE
jgi:hypothetical protein